MADVTHKNVDELEAIEGVLEGVRFVKAADSLGVTSFGMSIIDMKPGAAGSPEHDHSEEGIGAEMFAKRPHQLGREEVYVAIRGSGTVEIDGEPFPLDPDHVVRIGPTARRKVTLGLEGLRLLALGGIPGRPYGEP